MLSIPLTPSAAKLFGDNCSALARRAIDGAAMRFELHCHSTCSDGEDPPARVAELARERAIDVFALTDHDTCAGSDVVAGAGARTLRGVELSCDDPATGRTIHVLAFDRGGTGWADLEARLGALGDARRNRLRVMAARLTQRGIRIDVEPLIAQATGRSVGRPDLAKLMVAAGAVSSVKEAFTRHLFDGGPVDVPHHALALPDALALGRAVGAAMALAHPHVYDDYAAVLLRTHKPDGLDAVEACYASYDPRERTRWLDVARDLDLVCTAGSDRHTPGDPPLGVDLTGELADRLGDWLGR